MRSLIIAPVRVGCVRKEQRADHHEHHGQRDRPETDVLHRDFEAELLFREVQPSLDGLQAQRRTPTASQRQVGADAAGPSQASGTPWPFGLANCSSCIVTTPGVSGD